LPEVFDALTGRRGKVAESPVQRALSEVQQHDQFRAVEPGNRRERPRGWWLAVNGSSALRALDIARVHPDLNLEELGREEVLIVARAPHS